MEEKKIYSLNCIAYLVMNNIPLNWHKDADNKCYVVVDQNVTELLNEYRYDFMLHKFISAFKEVKNKIRELNS